MPVSVLFLFLGQALLQVFVLDSVSQPFHCIQSGLDLELVVGDAACTEKLCTRIGEPHQRERY